MKRSLCSLVLLAACLSGGPEALLAQYKQDPVYSYQAMPRPTRGTFDNDVVYYIMVDRFFDGNPANNVPTFAFPGNPKDPQERRLRNELNRALLPMIFDPTRSYMGLYWGGDLAGIHQKLAYLEELGVTELVLTPIMDNANGYLSLPDADFYLRRSKEDKPAQPDYAKLITSYHGYWIRDWYAIDEHFRDPKDGPENPYGSLRRLLDSAQDKDIGIVLDITLNQTSPMSLGVWPDKAGVYNKDKLIAGFDWEAVQTADHGWFHEYFVIDFTNPSLWQLEHGCLAAGLPDLDQSNEATSKYLLGVADFWMNINPGGAEISGFRVDAVKHVGVEFWQLFENDVILRDADATLFGEYWNGGYNSDRSLDFVRQTQYFSQYDFDSSFAVRRYFAGDYSWNGRPWVLRHLLTPRPPDRTIWQKLLDPGAVLVPPQSAREKVTYAEAASWMLFLENHDLPRLRTLYPEMSDEAYLSALAFILMAPRVPLLEYGVETGLGVPWDPRERGADGIGADPFCRPMMVFPGQPGFNQTIFQGTKKLISLRRHHDFLRFGNARFLNPPGGDYSRDLYLQRYAEHPNDDTVLTYAFAPEAREVTFTLPEGDYTVMDAMSGDMLAVSGRTWQASLEPQQFRIFLYQRVIQGQTPPPVVPAKRQKTAAPSPQAPATAPASPHVPPPAAPSP